MKEYKNKIPDAQNTTILSFAYMYEYICDIVNFCENNNYDFDRIRKDKMSAHGLVQCLAMIGEHAKTIRDKDPEFTENTVLPIHEMVGMRNRIEHQYKKIDWGIIEETIRQSIPQLKKYIEDNIHEDVLNDPYILYEVSYGDYINIKSNN